MIEVNVPSVNPALSDATPTQLRSPVDARRRADRLIDKRDERVRKSSQLAKSFEQVNAYLAIAGKVTDALEQLNEQLFQQLLGVVQEKLTIALQEILDQPIAFRAKAEFKRARQPSSFGSNATAKRKTFSAVKEARSPTS